ncbi:MAG: glycosyltransferase family A protein [Candidatus Micrarchaeota archaeon]
MKIPRISVIVPVGKHRLAELNGLRESLRLQTYRNFELIVEQGSNVAANRNRGAKKARGAMLLFLDSDIRISKGMLQLVADTLEQKQILVFWKATAFAALFKNDFVPFDETFRYAEDTKWFPELESRGVRIVELIENTGNPSIQTILKKSFTNPFDWRRTPGISMRRAFLSAAFDILKRLTTMAGILLSFVIRK